MDARCTVHALLLWLMFIDFCSKYANAQLIVMPKDTVVLVNQPTYFNCSTSIRNISASFVVWYHFPLGLPSRNDVYDEGQIVDEYKDRFRIETNVVEGVFNLVVERPSLADAGRYECQDGVGQGDKASAELIVLDVTPICESNMNTVGVVGQNDCGLEPDEIQLTCRVTFYHGNIPPTVEWKISGDENNSSLVVCERTTSCKLTLKANLTFNNQSLVCQTTKSRRQQYGCSIGPIKVKYALRSGAKRATEEDVLCMANSSQQCSYMWYNAKNKTVSSDGNLMKQKPGQYKCKALCEMNRQNDLCDFTAMEVEIIFSDKVCPDELDKEYSIHWRRTKAGTESYAPCPRNNSGTCSRNCSLGIDGNPLWSAPNCNGCFDKEFKELLEKVNKVNLTAFKNQTVIAKIASQLSTVTNKSEGLSSGNLNASVMMIKQLADLRTDSTINANAMEIKSIVQAANNVLQPNNSKSWQELENVNQNIATSILFSLDVYGRSLAALNTSDHSIEVQDSLVLEAWSFEKSNLREIEFPNRSLWDENRGDGISISVEAFKNSMSSESPSALHMWGSYYRTVNDYLPGNKGGTDDVNSRVLSFSIDGLKTNERLERPVLITLRHNQEKRTSFQRTCAFWNFSGGNWDSVGCSVTSTNLTHTICSCDHLTNFAILMSLKPKEDWLLSLISIIGCSISVAALILTIFVYALTWKQAKSAQATVLLNLCVALIIAYIIFMVGADKVISKGFSKIGCQTVAVLLHYFFLAAFFIMLAEGVELLLYIIFVFHVRRTRETVMLVISAWVLPLIIVGVSLGSTKLEGYGHEKACWLSSENHLIWAFVGPVLGIVAANFIILIIVLRWRSQKKALLSKNVKKRDEINATIWNLAVTCPVLGLGWLFGFLTLAFDHTVFHYMFVAVNSLQGLLIFIFHALFHNKRVNERISSLFSTYICSRCRNSDQAVITQSTSSSQDQPTKKADKKGRAPRGGMGKQGNVRGHGTQLTSFGDSETMESTQ